MTRFDGPEAPAPEPAGPAPTDTKAEDPVATAWRALGGVYDPEIGLDVVSLGLVYDIRLEAGTVLVEMTMTTPGCPASEALPVWARMAIAESVDPKIAVDVQVVWDPPWTPAMMNEEAAAYLGFRSR